MTWPENLGQHVEPHPADGTAPADIESVGGWDAVFPEPNPDLGDGSEYGEDELDGPGAVDPDLLKRGEERLAADPYSVHGRKAEL